MSCLRCGECCTDVAVPLPAAYGIDEVRWVAYHGGRIQVDQGGPCGLIPARCSMLSPDGRTCMIYEERPRNCRDYLCERAS